MEKGHSFHIFSGIFVDLAVVVATMWSILSALWLVVAHDLSEYRSMYSLKMAHGFENVTSESLRKKFSRSGAIYREDRRRNGDKRSS